MLSLPFSYLHEPQDPLCCTSYSANTITHCVSITDLSTAAVMGCLGVYRLSVQYSCHVPCYNNDRPCTDANIYRQIVLTLLLGF